MFDFSSFDYKTLKRLAQIKKIKSKNLNKSKLIEKLKEITSVLIIQKFFRKQNSIPDICPITLEPLVYPFVSIKNPNGHFNYYSLKGLTDFYIKSKKFICPNTRYEISFYKIKEITELYSFYYKKKLKTSTVNTNKKESPLELLWLGRTLMEYSEGIPNLNLTTDTINFDIMPYILNYLYYICLKDKIYAESILFDMYCKLETLCFENKSLILRRLRDINF